MLSHAHMTADFYKGADAQGPYYVVQYLFDDWADSDQVVNELMGIAYRVGSTTVRLPPHQHPLSPNLYCQSARVVGQGSPVLNAPGLPAYDGGFVVEAEYRTSVGQGLILPADDPSNLHQIDPTTPVLWCTQELDFATEAITVPDHAYLWTSDLTLADTPVKIETSVTTMSLTFHRLPYLPMTAVRAKRGKVNDATFLGAAAGTVLFVGAKTTREVTTDGAVTQRVQLVFKEREHPWNYFFRKDKFLFEDLVDAVGGRAYASTDLGPLVVL